MQEQQRISFQQNLNKNLQNIEVEDQNENKDNAVQEQQDQIDYYADDTPLPKAKPMDLNALWLSETNKSLQKFNRKFEQLKISQKDLSEGFRKFDENEHKYKLSSLRKIDFKLDHKKLYQEYMLRTRKTIQKLNPALFLNIISYSNKNLFLELLKFRRVSKIFYQIFNNDSIQAYLAQKDYLHTGEPEKVLKQSTIMSKKYVKFYKTFLYYKQMHYTEQIPQNSIMKDFEQAVNFINEIHKIVIERQRTNFTYYELMNQFMKKNRVVIGLSTLSLTSLVMVRKPAIIAFSNYLAFNQKQRSKQQITKTKYSKVISVVQYENYRDSLIINTKVSSYLWQKYNQNFAVLVRTNAGEGEKQTEVKRWNILVYHLHNEDKAVYLREVSLEQKKYVSGEMDIEFSGDMKSCQFAVLEYLKWGKLEATAKCMDIITSPLWQSTNQQSQNEVNQGHHRYQFGHCFFYHLQQYYIFAIPDCPTRQSPQHLA